MMDFFLSFTKFNTPSVFKFGLVCALLTLNLGRVTQSVHAQEQTSLLEVKKQAIRNGNLTPSSLILSESQQKAIGWLYVGGRASNRFCTATVISDNAVLTAKHCFYGKEAPPLNSEFHFAILSDQGINNQRENPVSEAFEPEEVFRFYAGDIWPSTDYDIAMVRFADRPFARVGLSAIPINIHPLEGEFGQNLLSSYVDVVGFGDTQHDNEKGRYFASVKLELITPTYIITNGEQEQGICNGDSGGPLLAAGADGNPTILAVVTNGDKCCVGFDQLTRVDLEAQNLSQFGNAYTSSGEPYSKDCWGIPRSFRCTKDVLHFCSDGQAGEFDCRQEGKICGYDAVDSRFDCISPNEVGCPGIPPQGNCEESTTLVRCEYGQERRIQCINATCKTIDDGERPACVPINSLETLMCDESNFNRLEWASEARFSTEPSCQTKAYSPIRGSIFIIIFFLIFTLRKKVKVFNI